MDDAKRKDFQAELCASIITRLNAQHAKGEKTRTERAIDMLCGAAATLTYLQSEYYTGVEFLAIMTATRGIEVVEKIARGEPL